MVQRNAEDMARDALSRIGVSQGGQAIEAEDLELALDRLGQVIDDLNGRGVCYIANPDSVDNALATHVATLAAIALRPDFADDGSFLPNRSEVESAIRALLFVRPTFAPMRTVNF